MWKRKDCIDLFEESSLIMQYQGIAHTDPAYYITSKNVRELSYQISVMRIIGNCEDKARFPV